MELFITENFSKFMNSSEKILKINRLDGMTNSNYLVETKNNKYIVKLFGKGTDKLINRVAEKNNMKIMSDLKLDVKNYVFDIENGIKINKYIEDALTYNNETVKNNLDIISTILKKVHNSNKILYTSFNPFLELEKYENLIEHEITYPYYNKIRVLLTKLNQDLIKLGIETKSCHIDLVPENFIMAKNRVYLIDWEYAAMCDPMWDLASLFLESNFSKDEELLFLTKYSNNITSNQLQKIEIYKIIQDILWSLWTTYKEEQGSSFGQYGKNRYFRGIKNLRKYEETYGK